MAFAFLDDDGDLPAQRFVSLLDDSRLVIEPGVEAAANVDERHAGLGQGARLSIGGVFDMRLRSAGFSP